MYCKLIGKFYIHQYSSWLFLDLDLFLLDLFQLPDLNDMGEMQKYFLEEIQEGELALSQGYNII